MVFFWMVLQFSMGISNGAFQWFFNLEGFSMVFDSFFNGNGF